MGQADDVERVEAGCRAQPHSLYKRRVAEQGGDAGGGSTLGTQSTFAQMGHIDSPGRSRLNRDIHFEKSPKTGGVAPCDGATVSTRRGNSPSLRLGATLLSPHSPSFGLAWHADSMAMAGSGQDLLRMALSRRAGAT